MALKSQVPESSALKGAGTKIKEFLMEAGLLPKDWISEADPSQLKYPAAQDAEELANQFLPRPVDLMPSAAAMFPVPLDPALFNTPRLKRIAKSLMVPDFVDNPGEGTKYIKHTPDVPTVYVNTGPDVPIDHPATSYLTKTLQNVGKRLKSALNIDYIRAPIEPGPWGTYTPADIRPRSTDLNDRITLDALAMTDLKNPGPTTNMEGVLAHELLHRASDVKVPERWPELRRQIVQKHGARNVWINDPGELNATIQEALYFTRPDVQLTGSNRQMIRELQTKLAKFKDTFPDKIPEIETVSNTLRQAWGKAIGVDE